MTEAKISDCLLVTLVLMTVVMFIWTVNIISDANSPQRTQTTISAYNG